MPVDRSALPPEIAAYLTDQDIAEFSRKFAEQEKPYFGSLLERARDDLAHNRKRQ
jgi:hypothetical protein